jgi:hypothetical protein
MRRKQRHEVYRLLVASMLIAALSELGISIKCFENCHSRQCVKMFQKKALAVLQIDWRPISVFTEEPRRYRDVGGSASKRAKIRS